MRVTQRKGDIAVSQAIATFTKLGFDVAIPVTESAAYDLIIDTYKGLKRVQVRYTSIKEVDLRRIHSNSHGYVIKKQGKTHMIGFMFSKALAKNIYLNTAFTTEDQ